MMISVETLSNLTPINATPMTVPAHLIGLVGTAASGKSYASEYILKMYGGEHIKFSDSLAHVLDKLKLEKSRNNMTKLSVILRKEFGEDVMSHAVAADAFTSEESIALVDGIRRVDDLAAFRALPNFKLIAINADPKIRFERQKQRHEKTDDTKLTWEQFQKVEQTPTEITIPEVLAYANYTIMNEGTKEEYEHKIDEIMADLGIRKKG
jgi:dephospho-CoA kinase